MECKDYLIISHFIGTTFLLQFGANPRFYGEIRIFSVFPGSRLSKMGQENIATAAFMVLFTADTTKAPPFMKGNLALFHDIASASASYSAQNIALAAGVFKLASIVMYNFKPDAAAAAAKLPKEELPLFIMQLGYTK